MQASQAVIVASLTESPTAEEVVKLSSQAQMLEVRADLVRDVSAEWLRSNFGGELLYTLRSSEEGGSSEVSRERRLRMLSAAASEYDLVDLESGRDLSAELLSQIPPQRRIISWHGPAYGLTELQAVFERMSAEGARYYKLVSCAEQSPHEMAPLALLHSLRRPDIVAFASGALATWTRLVAPRLGAPVVFGSAGDMPAAPGQLTVGQLIGDYGLPFLPTIERLCGVVGSNVRESLSPRLHNTLYRHLDLPILYLPFQVEAFGEFWLEIVESGSFEELGFRLEGLSVTAPHKRIASAVAGATSPLVELLGSANTLVKRNGVWEAESTDGEGVLGPLRQRSIELVGKRTAVVGVGGAGRAAAVALHQAESEVTLVNRSSERGRKVGAELRLPFEDLRRFDPANFDLLVNATPLGQEDDDPLPFELLRLSPQALVIDLVYRSSQPTRLVREVLQSGRAAIDGREVLLYQAIPQFRLMTGEEMPVERCRDLLGLASEE